MMIMMMIIIMMMMKSGFGPWTNTANNVGIAMYGLCAGCFH